MRIIPAIDIINGKCVRLTKGDYNTQIVYNEDPLEVAKQYEDFGIKYLHLVDLDGAKSQKILNYKVLDKIAGQTKLIIDFGGGIKSDQDVKIAFNSGASQITAGSVAVKKPDLISSWLEIYGPDKIILGADTLHGTIAVNGWMETSDKEVVPFVKYFKEKGIRNVISTDISKDGMLQGPSFALYEEIIKNVPEINVIASGGVSCIGELSELAAIGCEGVIIGKAIYEKKINLLELSKLVGCI